MAFLPSGNITLGEKTSKTHFCLQAWQSLGGQLDLHAVPKNRNALHVIRRAELEEALERLQRIVAAIDSEAEQAPPNTVEKAFKHFDSPATSGLPSPKLADAVSSGKIVTRRRMASHLRPIPYPLR
jgi:hypothetical protein